MVHAMVVLLGIIVGRFLASCIERLPKNQSVSILPSYCMHCQAPVSGWKLVPIVGYVLLKGRCRYCGRSYSGRYVVAECITGALFLWCSLLFEWRPELVRALIFTAFLIVIAFIDYEYQLILDKVLIWFTGTGLAINMFTGSLAPGDMLAAATVGSGLLLGIAVLTKGGMGGGDIKFAAVLGLWLGLELTIITLFIAFLLGGIGGGVLLACKLKGRKDFIPFGPFIAVAAFISMLYGQVACGWYWQVLVR